MQKPILDNEEFEKAISVVERWDFSLAIQKLQEPTYAGWSEERAKTAFRDYKRYLALTKALGDFQPVPNGDIDRFWHEHILDTRRYSEDCQSLFGGMLHHYPYFGMRGESDESNWIKAAEISNELWKELFGENLYNHISPTYNPTESNIMTTINITINIKDGVATLDVAKQDETSKQEDTLEIAGKRYLLVPSDATAMSDLMKCPQKCPAEG